MTKQLIECTRQDVDNAIERVLLGISAPDDGKLLAAWAAGVRAALEQREYGDDEIDIRVRPAWDFDD